MFDEIARHVGSREAAGNAMYDVPGWYQTGVLLARSPIRDVVVNRAIARSAERREAIRARLKKGDCVQKLPETPPQQPTQSREECRLQTAKARCMYKKTLKDLAKEAAGDCLHERLNARNGAENPATDSYAAMKCALKKTIDLDTSHLPPLKDAFRSCSEKPTLRDLARMQAAREGSGAT